MPLHTQQRLWNRSQTVHVQTQVRLKQNKKANQFPQYDLEYIPIISLEIALKF